MKWSLLLHYQCWQRGLWLSNIDEEQSEEWCNGVMERESSRLTNGAHSVFPSVSRSFQDDNLCSAQLPVTRSGFCGFITQLSSHILAHTPLCVLSSHLAVPPSVSYHPPSFPARLRAWTSPVGWIWGRFCAAVGCNPEVQTEPSQSPSWACHVPDLWHQTSEGHIRLLWEETLLLDSGQTEQPAGQQGTCLERVVVVLPSPVNAHSSVRWTNVPFIDTTHCVPKVYLNWL